MEPHRSGYGYTTHSYSWLAILMPQHKGSVPQVCEQLVTRDDFAAGHLHVNESIIRYTRYFIDLRFLLQSIRVRPYLFPALLFCLLLTTVESLAANYYVRKGATGSGKGSDWTNAFSELSQLNLSALTCGDTVWIAGGVYSSSLKGNASCTASNPLTINRVLASDAVPAAAVGWNASYDSLVTLPSIDIPGPAAYITIDGRTAYGIQVLIPGTSGDGIDGGEGNRSGTSQPIDHITFKYIEIYGPACVVSGTCTNGGVVGVNVMPYCQGPNRTNMLFDHLSVHRVGEAFRGCGWDNSIVQ
jgi:hypothetical protein